ncbi:alpha/beta hydrolase [Solwaraspora sp. WMMD791]|uniref:RBBP9/YdeN family alpha/beta hydrolase n=1 Tax=Solwaraspora sp. WMMD791 TaxID=3016086 RepID=UPI002499C3C0|nr:alpha/beta fold hydrolase [Solwaraspora sp. WMMD791]WFE26674.1 alpha/beta hydrolase [Solwaraspora sp. WMMD791]
MARHLLVPGRGLPRPEHWLNRWAAANPGYRWAPPPPGPPYVLAERLAALHAAITASDEPAVLIAHSAGCLTVAHWAARHHGPVAAALLVTPPYLDPGWRPGPDDPTDLYTDAVPRQRLPFRTVLVASRTDPYTTVEEFARYAADWGAELYDAGDAGHIETASGYGPWPAGERLVAALADASPISRPVPTD